MTLQIKVYSDYVCPYCFLAEGPLEEALVGRDVDVEWMPYELRPYPNETLRPEGEYLQRVWQQSVYPMAASLGVPIILPNVSPQPYTHLAFEGYQYAKENGKGSAYNDRVLRAFFQEQQQIDDLDVLTRLAEEVGLDPVSYREALETRKYRETHQQALQHAYQEANITAVPTFIIGKTKVSGICSKEVLANIIDSELKKQQEQPFEGRASCSMDDC